MKCDNCGRVLSVAEIEGDECQYCGAALPHIARAREKAAIAREVLADADGDGIPDIVQHLVPAAGSSAKGSVQVNLEVPGPAAGGPAAGLPDDVRARLAAQGIDLSNAVVVSTTTTTTTSSNVSAEEAERILAELGLGGAAAGTRSGSPATGGAVPPAGFAIGARVQVQWADGNRYPAQVVEARSGEYRVTFSDGRSMWVAEAYLSAG